jgi:hypothetical protein
MAEPSGSVRLPPEEHTMRPRASACAVLFGILAATVVPACGGEAAAVPFTIRLAPEFVQGAIPGATTGVLVTISNETETDEPVELAASAAGATVTVEPAMIRDGEVAEVTVVAGPAASETPLDIVVTGRRGGLEETATRSTTIFAWDDDRGEYAGTLLGLFTAWLAGEEPGLGIDAGTDFAGSYVAPGLLVVSHYLFMSEEWEIGLSWHVMTPPHDWAEIYLRPRDQAAPTLAFRLASQAAALEQGTVQISAVPVPQEVVR